jgi:16S rRNA (guanine966-N2)-methyltransferase
MRVVAGTAGGRRLTAPKGIRPTAGRVKSALFSSLGDAVAGGRVLDLYAGSGSLGIEALSRGAVRATFVETNRHALEAIRANLEITVLVPAAEVVASSAERFVEAGGEGQAFDLILIDPPYETGLPPGVLEGILSRGLLTEGGVVVLEISSRKLPFTAPAGLAIFNEKVYGDSALVYMRKAQ